MFQIGRKAFFYLSGLILLALVIGLMVVWFEKPEANEANFATVQELAEFSSANNTFALEIFPRIASHENIFISPYSIHTALLLAYVGAAGETRKEIEQVLALEDLTRQEIKQRARTLKNHLEHVSETTEVSIANALFLAETVNFRESYKASGRKYFEAELERLPVLGEGINEWIREKTEERITEVIDPGPIAEEIIAYLVNAIYFKGIWEQEFDAKKTTERTFYGAEEKIVDMMENRAKYSYGKTETLKSVTLEYKDGDYLFHAFMPVDEETGLEGFYQDISIDSLKSVREEMRSGELILRLPKFSMEKDMALAGILQDMGIQKAFIQDQANFSEMVELDKIKPLNVFMNQVYHSSFLEVDEEGTEASAATAVEIGIISLPPEPPTIEFNRPFFFIIEEAETETILFMGQFVG